MFQSERKELITNEIIAFWGGIYSNWAKTTFNSDSCTFSSVEQYLMYHKALTFGDQKNAQKILTIHNTSKIKEIGKEVEPYVDEVWARERLGVAVRGIYEKFKQNPGIEMQMLSDFNFGQRSFVEASPKDDIWGVKLSQSDYRVQDSSQWLGTNLLGVALDLVATRILIESGDNLISLPQNIAFIINLLPSVSSFDSESGVIYGITNIINNKDDSSFMELEDCFVGGESLHDSLRYLFGFEKPNMFINFNEFKPSKYKLSLS